MKNKTKVNTENVMYKCSRKITMKGGWKEVCFKNGEIYECIEEYPLTLKDEQGYEHELAPEWIKHFHKVENKQETIYSKEEFDGYTHRFIVQFEIGEPHFSNLTLFSNSDSYEELEEYIEKKKSEKVISFKIFHRASKEQDERTSKLIDETFKSI